MTKTHRKRIEKWLEALESGQLKQHRGSLTSKNQRSDCCLGVACRVYAAEVGGYFDPTDTNSDGQPRFVAEFIGEHPSIHDAGEMPYVVEDWFGLDGTGAQRVLAELNDEQHYSFKEIATYIREQLALPRGKRWVDPRNL